MLAPAKQDGQQRPTRLHPKDQNLQPQLSAADSAAPVENHVTAASVNTACSRAPHALDAAVIFYVCNLVELLWHAVQVLPFTEGSGLQTHGQADEVRGCRASIPRLGQDRSMHEVLKPISDDQKGQELSRRRLLDYFADTASEIVANVIKVGLTRRRQSTPSTGGGEARGLIVGWLCLNWCDSCMWKPAVKCTPTLPLRPLHRRRPRYTSRMASLSRRLTRRSRRLTVRLALRAQVTTARPSRLLWGSVPFCASLPVLYSDSRRSQACGRFKRPIPRGSTSSFYVPR